VKARVRSGFSLLICIVFCASLLAARFLSAPAYGAQLGPRSLQLSDSGAGVTAVYQLAMTLSTAGPLGSIAVQFCSNDPFPNTSCVAPVGLDISTATLTDQAGQTGFSIASADANDVLLSRTPAAATTGLTQYQFSGVQNPSNAGSYYVRVLTYASSDASGPSTDYGGIAFAIITNLSITAEVPPYLTFCTGITITGLNCANAQGDNVDFGELSSSQAKTGTSQMLVATNAAQGYSVSVHGTTMTSGNDVIAALASNDVSRPGTAQFGFNLRANSSPAAGNDPSGPGVGVPQPNYDQPNFYRFVDGDTVVNNPKPDDSRLYTSAYLVNVPKTQAPGVYVSTLTYICLADF
jgi:hypothetical protein